MRCGLSLRKPEVDPIDRAPRHEHDRAAVVVEHRAIVRGVVTEISSLVFECGHTIDAPAGTVNTNEYGPCG